MGRLIAGTLFVLVGFFGMISTANAAEIPPTEECSALAKQSKAELFLGVMPLPSNKKEKRAYRQLVETLAEADCISDADALLNDLKAKPRSEQCVAAAKAAGSFWAPTTKALTKLDRQLKRAIMHLVRRMPAIDRRIRKLRARGASQKRIRALKAAKKNAWKRLRAVNKPYAKKYLGLIRPQARDTVLIFVELRSLRCVTGESFFDLPLKSTRHPVNRIFEKNLQLLFSSLGLSALDYLKANGDFKSSGKAYAAAEALWSGRLDTAFLLNP